MLSVHTLFFPSVFQRWIVAETFNLEYRGKNKQQCESERIGKKKSYLHQPSALICTFPAVRVMLGEDIFSLIMGQWWCISNHHHRALCHVDIAYGRCTVSNTAQNVFYIQSFTLKYGINDLYGSDLVLRSCFHHPEYAILRFFERWCFD